MKRWSLFDHPSDLGLEAWADTPAGLFEALAQAAAEQVCPPRQVRPERVVTVQAAADGIEALAVELLSVMLHEFQLRRFLTREVRVTSLTDTAVSAELTGETYDPARHELGPEIKAVTWHQLTARREPDGAWYGRVLLDL